MLTIREKVDLEQLLNRYANEDVVRMLDLLYKKQLVSPVDGSEAYRLGRLEGMQSLRDILIRYDEKDSKLKNLK